MNREVRRALLTAAFVVLVVIDLSLVPLALLLIFIGGLFSAAGVGHWVPLVIFALVVGAVPVALTIIVGKALQGRR